jgi:hypothetical protein
MYAGVGCELLNLMENQYIQTHYFACIQAYRPTGLQAYRHDDIHTYAQTGINAYIHA